MTLPPKPPKAKQEIHRQKFHGHVIDDPYHWLRDGNYPEVRNPEILNYLQAENQYFEEHIKPHKGLKTAIFEELKSRIKDDDESVPVKDGDFLYWWKFEPGEQYRCWWRKPVKGGPDELILDERERANGHDFYQLASLAISPDGTFLAVAEDVQGDERFQIHFRRLDSQKWSFLTKGSSEALIWDANSTGLFWVELSEQHRPYKVHFTHHLTSGTGHIIYEEKDDSFFVDISRTQSREFLIINAGDHITSEAHLLPLKDPKAPLTLVEARKSGHEYNVDHGQDRLFIRTNDTHENFRIVTANPLKPNQGNWEELIAASDDHYIRGHQVFRDFLAIQGRMNGLDQIQILSAQKASVHNIEFEEESFTVSLGANPEYAPSSIRLSYQSMVTPPSTLDYAVEARKVTILKVQEIPSGYNPSQFTTQRIEVPARDGSFIPVSIVYKKGVLDHGPAPLHLYGYGAYGIGMSPSFSTSRLSLLERGFVYAIAHIRGGDDLGYRWYREGKFFKRWNSFTDFIDVAHFLINEGYSKAQQISISGGSAGGTLMGVCANLAPELWRAVVAHVPFVDVLNTMLDGELPLTPIEWPEWGNPISDPAAFAFIRSYSPYDNVVEQNYPHMLVTAGLHDPRVTYWEPAKWVAKLRELKSDNHMLLLKTNMGAGHGGKTGRYIALEETAEEYTFILMAFDRI